MTNGNALYNTQVPSIPRTLSDIDQLFEKKKNKNEILYHEKSI